MPQNMPKGTRSTRRSADSYGSGGPKTKGVKKATYKPGGLYSTGRAIPPGPGTKARAKFRDSDTSLGKTTSAKTRNMPASRKNVTSYSPRKSADAMGSPRKPSRAR